jgi:hypothetical protein
MNTPEFVTNDKGKVLANKPENVRRGLRALGFTIETSKCNARQLSRPGGPYLYENSSNRSELRLLRIEFDDKFGWMPPLGLFEDTVESMLTGGGAE